MAAVILTLAAWHRVPLGTFQYDDHDGVVTSRHAPESDSWTEAWRGGFRPLLRTSFLADRALWGAGPLGHLATNLAIHLACVCAVLALARRRNAGPVGATAAALAFALQPAQAEAVAYVSGRSASLSTLLVLAALLAHDRAAATDEAPSRRRHLALSLALFLAAAAVKEVALIFPLLVVVWELTRPEPRTRSARPLLLAHAAAFGLAAIAALSSGRLRSLLEFSLETSGPWKSLSANLAALPGLLSLWIRPGALSVEHAPVAPTTPAVAIGATLVVAAVGCGLALARRCPAISLALLWPLIALAPSHSLLWKLDPTSERSLYLPWVGPALALGAAAEVARRWAATRPRSRLAMTVLASALVVAGFRATFARIEVWRDSRTLWRDATAKAPASVRAWNNLGMAYWEHDEPAPARAAFRRVLEIAPRDALAAENLMALALGYGADPK